MYPERSVMPFKPALTVIEETVACCSCQPCCSETEEPGKFFISLFFIYFFEACLSFDVLTKSHTGLHHAAPTLVTEVS